MTLLWDQLGNRSLTALRGIMEGLELLRPSSNEISLPLIAFQTTRDHRTVCSACDDATVKVYVSP
jgi:hypothetical protein